MLFWEISKFLISVILVIGTRNLEGTSFEQANYQGGGGGGGHALSTQQYDSLYTVVSLKKIKFAVSTFMYSAVSASVVYVHK